MVFSVLVLCAVSAMWTGDFQALPGTIENEYIVVFQTSLTAITREAHYSLFSGNLTVIARHSIGDFHAYSAKITDERVLAHVTKSAGVAYVEQNAGVTIMGASCTTEESLPAGLWGLTRINQRARDANGRYTYYATVETTVRAYVIDTGVLITHVDFEGRAVFGANMVGDGVDSDRNGHGTHVASTIAGRTYGVSKSASIISVKVLGTGSGTWTPVIRGVQWVAEDCAKYRGVHPCVANMSLGGGRLQALDDAVDAATASGVSFVVASGNSNQDACTASPASAPTAFTVGAITQTDVRATFSNWGRCQKAWAPGMQVLGAWINADTATNTISGTSVSAPHAAGVVANVLSQRRPNPPLPPAEVFDIVRNAATVGLITDGKEAQGTPNLLVFTTCAQ